MCLVGVSKMNFSYFSDTNHKMVSRIAAQILGLLSLPWSIPSILCKLVVPYALLASLWSIFSKYSVHCRILISIYSTLGGRTRRWHAIIVWGGTMK